MRQNLRQHWDRERMGSKAEINGNGSLTNGRKVSKTAEELAKNKRSASISSAPVKNASRVVRPVARQIRQKPNNRSTD